MKPRYEEMTDQEMKLACALKMVIRMAEDPQFGCNTVGMAQHELNLAKEQLEKLVGDSYDNICAYMGEAEYDSTKVKHTGSQLLHVGPINKGVLV